MLLPLFLALGSSPADEVGFYIGTYTSANGSKGIYHARINTKNGNLSKPTLAVEAPGPSFLAIHPSGKYLYAVLEPTNGDVSSFAIGADRKLRHLNTQTWKGAGPCHLSVDPAGKNVLTAAYTGGSFGVFPIKADGSLGEATSSVKNDGEKPRGHAIQVQSRFAYACDLGTDELIVFRYDAAKGTLMDKRAAILPKGSGPRHLALHPNGRYIFVNNEMGNSVTSFVLDDDGLPSPQQIISTLPEGVGREGKSTAEILCHPSGKWLYVSNRGHDSVAVYSIAADGTLKLVEIEPAGVRVPRGMGIDPSGRWLVVAGQASNDMTSLSVDAKTGELSPTGHRVSLDMPVCVLFETR